MDWFITLSDCANKLTFGTFRSRTHGCFSILYFFSIIPVLGYEDNSDEEQICKRYSEVDIDESQSLRKADVRLVP